MQKVTVAQIEEALRSVASGVQVARLCGRTAASLPEFHELVRLLDSAGLLDDETKARLEADTVCVSTRDDSLPEDFPARALLIAAGVSTLSAARLLTQDDLVALRGIGPVIAAQIAEAAQTAPFESSE